MSAKYLGYWLAQRLCLTVPSASAWRLAQRLADWQWEHSAIDRAAVCANLSLVLGAPVSERSAQVREVFRHFGRYLVEFFTMHRAPAPHVEVEGLEHLQAARRRHGAAVLLTAHVGNWELGAVAIRRLGFPVAAVALPHEDPRMNRLFDRQRQRCGVEVIPLGHDAARTCMRRLRAGALVGILGDRVFAGGSVVASWCGRPIQLPRGPALLSLRSRVPIVPTCLIRAGDGTFRLVMDPPIDPPRHVVREQTARRLTQAYAAALERYVRRWPEQWLLFQPVARAP